MIIAGNCLMADEEDIDIAVRTAKALKERNLADYFRCKIWGGGTSPQKYFKGMGLSGLLTLEQINRKIMSAGTEVQIPEHIDYCNKYEYKVDFIWVGARNCQNYALLERLEYFKGDIFIKRGFGITVDEMIGLYDIIANPELNRSLATLSLSRVNKEIYIIERGIITFDRLPDSRWSPDLKGVIRIKNERPDIFNRLVVDCSHSVGRKEYSGDVYRAFKAIGVSHFMFECSVEPEKSKTDKGQILSIEELETILKEGR